MVHATEMHVTETGAAADTFEFFIPVCLPTSCPQYCCSGQQQLYLYAHGSTARSTPASCWFQEHPYSPFTTRVVQCVVMNRHPMVFLNTRACQAGSGLFCACDAACCLAHQQGWNAGCSAIQLFEMAPCICPVCMQYSVQLFQPQQNFSLHFHQCWGVVMFETCSCMLWIANPQP